MRKLSPAPRSFVDGGEPIFGSFEGPLPPIDLGQPLLGRVLRRKKWVWLGVATEDLWISLAVVRMGYASSAFLFAFDRSRESGRMLVDRSVIGPAHAAAVADDPHAVGVLACFERPGAHISVERRSTHELAVNARLDAKKRGDDALLELRLDETRAPPPISAIARLAHGQPSATEKRALVTARGHARLAGRDVDLSQAIAGYDYTHGSMPRRTRWRWGFALGRTTTNEPFALNVVEGFVGEAECAAFTSEGVFALSSPKFDLDPRDPTAPWRVVGDGVDLTVDIGAVHQQVNNLVVVRSRFLQPVGTYRGSVSVGGREMKLESVLGVVEDQDVVW